MKRKVGRPPKEFDQKNFESLCQIQCTEEEICQFFSCSEKTLNKWCREKYGANFSQVFREKRGVGKISLRRAQFQAAINGNASLLIWLGKQYLGQSESAGTEEKKEIEDLTPVSEMLKLDDGDQ